MVCAWLKSGLQKADCAGYSHTRLPGKEFTSCHAAQGEGLSGHEVRPQQKTNRGKEGMWTEERDSLQMAHIPVSGKGPRLVLLWTALPKFPEARSLFFPEFPSLALQFITSSATGFIYSLHLLWHPLLCHPLLPHFPPASDWAPQECITRMGRGGRQGGK